MAHSEPAPSQGPTLARSRTLQNQSLAHVCRVWSNLGRVPERNAKPEPLPPTGAGTPGRAPHRNFQAYHRHLHKQSVNFFLMIHYLQFEIKREKVVGKKFLEDKVLSGFVLHQPPRSPVDGGVRNRVHFTSSSGFLESPPTMDPRTQQAGLPSDDQRLGLPGPGDNLFEGGRRKGQMLFRAGRQEMSVDFLLETFAVK